MNRRFARDLRRWEEGEITSSLLEKRYPRREVSDLTELYSTVRSLTDEPVADMVPSWNEVRSRIASRRQAAAPSLLQRLSPGLHRRLAMGVAAALLALPPMAFAATSDSVKDSVTSFVGNVTVFVMGEEEVVSDAAAGNSTGASTGGSQTSGGTTVSSVESDSPKVLQDAPAPKLNPAQAPSGTSGTSSEDGGASGGSGSAGAAGSDASSDGSQQPAAAPGGDGSSTAGSDTPPAPAEAPVPVEPTPSSSPAATPAP